MFPSELCYKYGVTCIRRLKKKTYFRAFKNNGKTLKKIFKIVKIKHLKY
jgi:hypothetical protein